MTVKLVEQIDELAGTIYSLEQKNINEKFISLIELLMEYIGSDQEKAGQMVLVLEIIEESFKKKDYVSMADGLFLLKRLLLMEKENEKDVKHHA